MFSEDMVSSADKTRQRSYDSLSSLTYIKLVEHLPCLGVPQVLGLLSRAQYLKKEF